MKKKAPDMKTLKANKDGWSRWQAPKMKGYLLGCCDCGLIHEVDFEVVRPVGPKLRNGWRKSKSIKSGRVLIRMKRYE